MQHVPNTGSESRDADRLTTAGSVARCRGSYREAEELLSEALEVAERTSGFRSLWVAEILNELGMVCKYFGRFDEGRRHYERALAIVLAELGPRAPDVAAIYHNLGGLEHACQDFRAAEPYAREAIRIRAQALGPEHIDVARDKAAHAAILAALGCREHAAAIFREAIGIFQSAGDEHEVAVNLNNLAAVVQDQGQLKEAERLYRQALRVKERTLGPAHPETALTFSNLAVNYERQGRHEDAERLFKRALELLEEHLQPGHPAIHACRRNYANLLRGLNRNDGTPARA